MIIVRLKGGLGNQMFQYAIGRALSFKYNIPLKLDIYSYKKINSARNYDLDVFNIKAEIAKNYEIPKIHRVYQNNKILIFFYKILKKILPYKGKEKSFSFDPNVFNIGNNIYLDGYWQSPKYFTGFEDIIRKDFTLKNLPNQNIQTLAVEISKTNSLCIHVRRGDYVGNPAHEVVNTHYYQKGIQEISKLKTIEKIYVFSDDIEWCKNNLKFEFPTMFVDESFSGQKGEGHMYLMSKCHNFIIANSSFSWWAAWLSTVTDKIVICPKQWFVDATIDTSDLIPERWIRI